MEKKDVIVNVIGAGLAGVEATYQLIQRGIKVNLYEMRGSGKSTPAHKTANFAELVCSNSLRAKSIENAIGLLKEEMNQIGSIVMESALKNEVEAGGALAVDREGFSTYITEKIKNHPLVTLKKEEVNDFLEGYTIIAAGPLCSDTLSEKIKNRYGDDDLYFFDAVAPIVKADTINKEIAYLKSRYDKGEACYYNCPMNEEEFKHFYQELIHAERVVSHDFDMRVFEGCMAVEDMASRGEQTLLFGPMKPVGLRDPRTNQTPYAVVQLRQDDAASSMYNIVGFQTHLKWDEQKRIIHLIPGLENAEIVRYGVMHRNTYINGPKVLNKYYQTKDNEKWFFAGQITGVEGYLESASSGMVAGINMARLIEGKELIDFSKKTSIGALQNYVSIPNMNYVPMNANFCLFDEITYTGRHLGKRERKEQYASRSLETLKGMLEEVKSDIVKEK